MEGYGFNFMNKKTAIILILILMAIILCLFTILVYNLRNVNNFSSTNNLNIENVLDSQNSLVVQTSSEEIRLSPNAIMIFGKNYNDCEHIIKSVENISPEMVNMSEDEFASLYSDWKITKFTSAEVELSKTFNGICGEHFLVKSNNDGCIDIYNINADDSLELKEKTEIAVKYLSNSDIKELETGVTLYGKENLNAYIENFE